eukprot:TsM_000319700 transcript=TsM_000319700 gene=TsM_000319700
MVHPDRAPQVKDHQDSQGPMGESSGMCQQGCRSLVPSGPCWAASTMENGPRGKGCLCAKGVPRHLYKGKPSGMGKVGAPRMLTKGDVKSISWGPIPPTSLGHAGQEMDGRP